MFELVLAVVLVYTPGLNGLFSMEAVHIAWFAVVPAAAAIFILIDQGRRALLSARGRRPAVAAT